MQKYRYTAIDINKEKFKGIFIAQDERDLARQLVQQNLYLVSCKPYTGATPSSFFTLGTGKVTIPELNTFCRQFAIMVNAGMPIVSCIESLKSQEYTAFFKSILEVVNDDVKSGMMMSEALEKHGSVFPSFFRSMIYVGEISGKLDLVLNSLADYYENDMQIRKSVKGALAYPIMLLCMTVGIIIAMMVFIVPTFRDSLSSLDIVPTGITKVVYDVSDFFLANWQTMILVVVGLALAIFIFLSTNRGKELFDIFKVKCPLVKKIVMDMTASRFARGFSLLLTSGMDIIDSLDAVKVILGNRDITRRFNLAIDDVRQGAALSTSFNKYKLFPALLTQMVNVGERTNTLDEVLTRSCSYFDEQVNTTIKNIVGIIQPILLMIMGGTVGVLFIAIYSPMLSIMTSF